MREAQHHELTGWFLVMPHVGCELGRRRKRGGGPRLRFSTCTCVARAGGSLLHKALPGVSELEVLALAKATLS